MTVHASVWAAQQTAGGPLNKLILMFLADWTDQTGFRDLSGAHGLKALAESCEVPELAIEDALKDLAARGLLKFEGSGVQMAAAAQD